MLVSRTRLWLSVCPCDVFNGPSTHSTSLVRMMLITVQHLATLPCCSSHTHTCTSACTRTLTYRGVGTTARKPAKMHASEQTDHEQMGSCFSGRARVFTKK